ncbi:MAG TPA: hypothetical protein VKX17_02750 [Planctomycetota bacterium]|nr:hypothetical protein [Planctomycetota bacterium]
MDASPTVSRPRPGRGLLLMGLALSLLGVAAYAAQVALKHLTTPWYLPAVATAAVLLVIAALVKARGVWRVLSLLLVLAIAGISWALIFVTSLPAYSGPVAVGKPIPAFSTLRANGAAFTQRDFEGPQTNVVVFFRGRW